MKKIGIFSTSTQILDSAHVLEHNILRYKKVYIKAIE